MFRVLVGCVSPAGEASGFVGDGLIREESVEVEAAGDRSSDPGTRKQAEGEEQEEEQSPTAEQQTQETEVLGSWWD